MTRKESIRLYELGLLNQREFLQELVIEPGDNVPEKFMGKSFMEYLEAVRNQMNDEMHIPGQAYDPLNQEGVKLSENGLLIGVIDVMVRPPLTTQWISMGITIRKTSDDSAEP